MALRLEHCLSVLCCTWGFMLVAGTLPGAAARSPLTTWWQAGGGALQLRRPRLAWPASGCCLRRKASPLSKQVRQVQAKPPRRAAPNLQPSQAKILA